MVTETLSWAAQSVGTDEQLAILGLGSTYTSSDGGAGGSVEVTATLITGADIESEIDYNYSGPSYDYDTGYLNAGEIYTGSVYTGEEDGMPTTTNSGFLLTNDGDTYTSPSGMSHTVTAQFDFATNDSLTYEAGVENLSFWIGDIDSGAAFDQIEIIAYAPDGVTLIAAVDIQFLSVGSNVNTGIVGGVSTLSAGPNSVAIDSPDGAVQVFIAVPVGRIEVVYYNGNTGAQAITLSDFSFDSIPLAPGCFAAGTLIKTPRGEVPVEQLAADDLVITARSGPMPIRWIGHRSFAAKGKLAPICITKGVLGNTRDLLVSPMHRMAISGLPVATLFAENEVLVPAEALLDGDRIYGKSGGEVTYYHILLNSHEIVFAEGAPAESLFIGQDGSELSGFSQAALDEVRAIFPELEMKAARPLLNPAEAALLTSFAAL
ncbi:MAG: Hint domain-containing protein [Rhodobacteraceae bacterium]|nr:Hint domain-containing protein [Paracoccaceae bacterium]